MKKVTKKFLSKKRNIVFLIIIASAIIISMSFTIAGIVKNVQQMTEITPEDIDQYFPEYPPVDTAGKNPELIKRGEYIAKAGDCIACHTNSPEKGKTFAGGLPMQTPFGTIYSPNITPDKTTGIGGWTQEEFNKAMREGISPDGHYYYPAFPYLYFSKVTTEDLIALKAYLDSIPPVKQQNKPNEMVWPFNVRLLQMPWRLLFFHPNAVYKGIPNASPEWKRGEYLVEGLGHCAMCHSPSYKIFTDKLPLGAPIQKFSLTGNKIQGYLAPNITKANLSEVSEQDIIDVFTKDKMIGGGPVQGPMLEVNRDSLRYLTPEDLRAIAVYLKSVQSQTPPKPSGAAAGKALYENYCSGCHASGAGGAPKYGDANDWSPLLKNGNEQVYHNAIVGINGMPAKGTCMSCNDQDIKQAVDFMIASVVGPDGKITSIKPTKSLTMNDGKLLYEQNCSVCHEGGFQNAPKTGNIEAWKPIIQTGFLDTYINVLTGRKGHPPRGACAACSDAELKAAVKYMMQQSAPDKDYSLW